ncbi:hypothetical protein C0J52_17369 [Blattella germanica]|nr:hypothetical protein C0J52_17369 [Blattella germanica]
MPIRRKCRLLLQNVTQKIILENKRPISVMCKNVYVNNLIASSSELSRLPSDKQKAHCVFSSHYISTGSCVFSRNFSSTSPSNMRFVQFTGTKGGPRRLGVQLSEEGDIFDISGVDSSIPNGLVQFLRTGDDMMEKTKRIVAEGKSLISLSEVKLLPPVMSPDKVACVGLNYRGHCEEQKRPIPDEPVFFSKWSSCIVGPDAEELDYEVELAVVIGKTARDVRPKDAMNYVFGFTVAQDITARDWQKRRNGGQWLLGKSMDGSCPLGPAVVIKEVLPNPHTLPIRCKVNGELKQDANTDELIHKIDFLISYLSRCCTLLPGDVILTGTPAGVGVFRNPQEFLKPGDVIESEIDGVGKLTTRIV